MLFSESRKRKIVCTSTAETVGKVSGFVVDPAPRRVVALRVKKSQHGDTLAWPQISGFGPDAVTIAAPTDIGPADEAVAALRGKRHAMLRKQVLSSDGDRLGDVTDVEFDPETGAIEALLIDGTPVAGDRLMGVGSFAVVVKAAPDAP